MGDQTCETGREVKNYQAKLIYTSEMLLNFQLNDHLGCCCVAIDCFFTEKAISTLMTQYGMLSAHFPLLCKQTEKREGQMFMYLYQTLLHHVPVCRAGWQHF